MPRTLCRFCPGGRAGSAPRGCRGVDPHGLDPFCPLAVPLGWPGWDLCSPGLCERAVWVSPALRKRHSPAAGPGRDCHFCLCSATHRPCLAVPCPGGSSCVQLCPAVSCVQHQHTQGVPVSSEMGVGTEDPKALFAPAQGLCMGTSEGLCVPSRGAGGTGGCGGKDLECRGGQCPS